MFVDRAGQRKDITREGLGRRTAKTYILRYVLKPLELIHRLLVSEYGTDYSIRSGKILQDDKTVESYSIEEKGFVVCMVSKVVHPRIIPI